jgi:acyl-CoA reductase-like NAD-dependent aldehyde dehydrogenase
MKVARGTEEGTQVGPLIDEDQRQTVSHLVDEARVGMPTPLMRVGRPFAGDQAAPATR